MISHTLASLIWHHSMLGRHPTAVVASLHCGHPDLEVDMAVTAVAQFVAVLLLGVFTLRSGSVVVDLCEMIGQIAVNALIIAAGHSMYLSSLIY